jgi:hypothetical protein
MSAPYRRIIVLAMLSIDSQPSRLTSGCMNTWNTLGRISASSPVANAQKAWKPDRGGVSGCRQYFPRAHTAQLNHWCGWTRKPDHGSMRVRGAGWAGVLLRAAARRG